MGDVSERHQEICFNLYPKSEGKKVKKYVKECAITCFASVISVDWSPKNAQFATWKGQKQECQLSCQEFQEKAQGAHCTEQGED